MSKNQRVRLTAHSTNISNVVLVQYQQLSDGAKLTYFVLESYDWPDETGKSKGKCWPAIETLAQARGKSYDTIMRHLKELGKAGLIQIESGQETGTTNCYWLHGPSVQETELYIKNKTVANNSKPTPVSEPVEIANQPETQICETTSPKIALPTTVFLQDHEESNMNKQNKHEDSNHKSAISYFPKPPKSQNSSPYLVKLMDDFSRTLNDVEHAASNRSQILNLYRESGLEERSFTSLLYEAKKRAQWAAVNTLNPIKGGPNRAAYFFRVVRDLLATQTQPTRSYYLHKTN